MPTQAVPAPQRIWEIGTPSTEPPAPAHRPVAGRVTAVAAVLFAGSGAVGGRLIDASGCVEGIAAFASRSVTVVAGAVALIGGVVVLAQAARRLRRRAARWATALGLWIACAWLVATPVAYAVYLTHPPERRSFHDVDLGAPEEPVTVQAPTA